MERNDVQNIGQVAQQEKYIQTKIILDMIWPNSSIPLTSQSQILQRQDAYTLLGCSDLPTSLSVGLLSHPAFGVSLKDIAGLLAAHSN